MPTNKPGAAGLTPIKQKPKGQPAPPAGNPEKKAAATRAAVQRFASNFNSGPGGGPRQPLAPKEIRPPQMGGVSKFGPAPYHPASPFTKHRADDEQT